LIPILASVFGAVFLATAFAVALGIVAARADERLDRQVREELGDPWSEASGDAFATLAESPALATVGERPAPLSLARSSYSLTVSVPSMPAWRWPGTEQ
jgi:hypothetical protein